MRPAAVECGIGDYAAIGDCRSAALVSKGGSIDWLCWPRFDSPSIFAALLDPSAGAWRIAPEGASRVERRYLPRTNILETRFRTGGGDLVLIDFMPVAHPKTRDHQSAEHEILRIARCESGSVDVRMDFLPRPEYGQERVVLRDAGAYGFRMESRQGLLTLRTDLPSRICASGAVESRTRLRAGQSANASLSLAREGPAVLAPFSSYEDTLRRSISVWERWASDFAYDGPWRDEVLRSALALKLLVYAPSGAVVAAPTTSLPERLGGELNWDYRFAWLRDAALTVRALIGAGFRDEALAFSSWLLHATALTRPELRILYDVFGRPPGPERLLEGFRGFAGSRPVRIGNAAREQLQLDVYGEIMDALLQHVGEGTSLDRDTAGMIRSIGRYVAHNWARPDEGIWEPRSGRRPHTHSRLLCWAALDRLLELHGKGHLHDRGDARLWARERKRIRGEIEEKAWNPALESYASEIGGSEVDAALLLMPWHGFDQAGSDRMRATYQAVRRRLGAGRSLLYRYRAGESQGEGAFGIASFWGVEFLALGGGSLDEAERAFEDLLAFANDVGLYAEEIDPRTGGALGNFPQGFTHVGLINAALTIQKRRRGEPHVLRDVSPRSGRW